MENSTETSEAMVEAGFVLDSQMLLFLALTISMIIMILLFVLICIRVLLGKYFFCEFFGFVFSHFSMNIHILV